MNTERKKQIKLDAVIKVQNFLEQCKTNINDKFLFSADKLARSLHTNGSVATHAVRLGILKQGEIKGEYYLGENFGTDRQTAKKIIESIRIQEVTRKNQKDIERSQALMMEVNSGGTPKEKRNLEQDSVPEIKGNTSADLASILKKALSTATPLNNQTLFYGQEKEFDDKLKIACAIASGCYVQISDNVNHFDFQKSNDYIVLATNDLYLKLKNN